jgi:transcriptional regulator with XRE-family HTH domain
VPPRDHTAAYLTALGQAVRRVRQREGLSQEEAAFQADLDRTYFSGVERGVRNPSVKTLLRLCRALGTTPAGLLRIAESKAVRDL